MAKYRLKLDTRTNIKRALTRISNMVLNGQIDSKAANTIILACNAMLSVLKQEDGMSIFEIDGGNNTMRNSRQYKIQSLLRMAEITDNEAKRKEWLEEAEKLVFQDVPKEIINKVLEESK
ncbi:hypothetical protein LAD12857_49590 [Lacrimispora amygdalina]|uniref:Phage protein n=1 Tax=Lacrimispora amygdalina TaxID=253257 RepID=A0ABQ5MDZ4_9FIRM